MNSSLRLIATVSSKTRVSAAYTLEPLDAEEVAQWDRLIEPFATREIFHRSPWLKYLQATHGVELRYWRVTDHGRTVGYFTGGLVHKGPFTILGSPLRGWGTNYMGPVVDPSFDQPQFLRALDDVARREGFSIVELENCCLNGEIMSAAGYEAFQELTYIVELLPNSPAEMWKRLAQRSQVRKALRAGLSIEDPTDSSIAIELHSQCVEVLRRKGLPSPFRADVPRLMFENLKPHEMLYSLQVRDKSGQTVATGFFPHDSNSMVYWWGASTDAGYQCAANDLMHWTAMEKAASQGLRRYDLSGNGFFKSKFGGQLHTLNRWHKCYSPLAKYARSLYEAYHRETLNCRKRWHRFRGGVSSPF